jgi:hypothetical protein
LDPKFIRIRHHRHVGDRRDLEADAVSGGDRFEGPSCFLEDIAHADWLDGDRDASRLDTGEVEDIVNQAKEMLATLQDLLDSIAVARRERLLLVALK